MTTIVRVEHSVGNFDAWKQMFDSDPLGRKSSGVKQYRIFRSIDNPNHVMIDLEFNDRSSAESFRDALKRMWSSPDAQKVMVNPQVHVIEQVERREL
jgi:hypothetical protein